MELKSIDLEYMKILCYYLSHYLKPTDIVCLNGQLGSGKTTFAKYLVQGFMNNMDLSVPSPSYLLSLEYEKIDVCKIFHIDPYRLPEKKILNLLDFNNIFQNHIALIEWNQRLGEDYLYKYDRLEINISGFGPQGNVRDICIKPYGIKWNSIINEIINPQKLSIPKNLYCSSNYQSKELDNIHQKPQDILNIPNFLIYILGIETSCDDTALAVVRGDGLVMSDIVISQNDIHQEYGGVYPKLAQEAHIENIDRAIDQVITKSGIEYTQLTAVAVTIGPGLSICLQVGMSRAIQLSHKLQIPIIKTHHLESHLMVSKLPNQNTLEVSSIQYPFITALISGGHTQFILAIELGNYVIIGETLDDSAGETFDKIARSLGIENIPGGPKLEEMATKGNPKKYNIPMPLINSKDILHRKGCSTSFSGIKTSVIRLIEKEKLCVPNLFETTAKYDIAASFQYVATKHLCQRLERTIQICQTIHSNINDIIIAGGVAANKYIRGVFAELSHKYQLNIHIPNPTLCRDNGIMVAINGIERYIKGLYEQPPIDIDMELKNIEVRPKWLIGKYIDKSILIDYCNKLT